MLNFKIKNKLIIIKCARRDVCQFTFVNKIKLREIINDRPASVVSKVSCLLNHNYAKRQSFPDLGWINFPFAMLNWSQCLDFKYCILGFRFSEPSLWVSTWIPTSRMSCTHHGNFTARGGKETLGETHGRHWKLSNGKKDRMSRMA